MKRSTSSIIKTPDRCGNTSLRIHIALVLTLIVIAGGIQIGYERTQELRTSLEPIPHQNMDPFVISSPDFVKTDTLTMADELLSTALADPNRFDTPSRPLSATHPTNSGNPQGGGTSNPEPPSPSPAEEPTLARTDSVPNRSAGNTRRVAASYAALTHESIRDPDSARNVRQRERMLENARRGTERVRGRGWSEVDRPLTEPASADATVDGQ